MSGSFLVPKIVRNIFKGRKKRGSGVNPLAASAVMDDTSAMGLHDWIPNLNDVEAFHYEIALALSRVDAKEIQSVNCETPPAERVMTTTVFTTNNNEALSAIYYFHGVLEYEDTIQDGFYDAWGEFPEVASPGTFPALKPLKRLRLGDSDLREVVLFSENRDSIFPLLEEAAKRVTLQLASEGKVACIQALAQIVSAQLGGAVNEESALFRKWQKSSQRAKQKFKSVVYPIGKLRVGLSRHRAFLFKVLADRLDIPCRLVRGLPYNQTPAQAVALVKVAEVEVIVDLICQPGRLMRLETAEKSEKGIEVVFAEAPPLPNEPYWIPMHSLRGRKQNASANEGQNTYSNSLSWPQPSQKTNSGSVAKTQGITYSTGGPVKAPTSAFGEIKTPFDPPQTNTQRKQTMECARKGSAMMSVESWADPAAWSNQATQGSMNRQCSCNSALSGHSWNDETDSTPVKNQQQQQQQQSAAGRLKTNYEIPEEQSNQSSLVQNSGGEREQSVESQLPIIRHTSGITSPFQWFDLPMFDGREEGQDPRSASDRHDSQDSIFTRLEWSYRNDGFSNALAGAVESCLYGDCSIQASEIQLETPRLAVGSYGEVFKGTWNGTDVAVKKLLEQDVSHVVLEDFLSEVRIMKRLRHPNVLLFMGVCMHPSNLAIVTEFLPRGSLYKLLHKTQFNDNRLKLRMAKDVIKGMCYLHSHKPAIVHRDLKSPNLLVDKDWTVKVCDFGMSKMKANTYLSRKSQGGTPEWMAPEVLRYESSDEKCDVYSFGVVLYELVTGLPPWPNLKPMQVVGVVGYQGKQLPLPQEIDPRIASIIKQCWSPNSRNRPSFQELLVMLSQFETLPCCIQKTTS